jgi:outer membrane protein OmpA-like peptidoglycan-associated protein
MLFIDQLQRPEHAPKAGTSSQSTFPEAVGSWSITELGMMKTLTRKILGLGAALFYSALLISSAQTTTADKDLKKKEVELERQKLDLEKKRIELERKELDLEKAKQELQYQETGKSMSMNLSGDVLFDYNKAALKPAAEEALKKVAVVLSLFPESNVTVEGYTDSKGGKKVNLQLSRERATAVKNWLVKNGGVAPRHIIAKGFGEENPVASNANPDGSDNIVGRAKNRRVTIIVDKPVTSPTP